MVRVPIDVLNDLKEGGFWEGIKFNKIGPSLRSVCVLYANKNSCMIGLPHAGCCPRTIWILTFWISLLNVTIIAGATGGHRQLLQYNEREERI